MTHLKHINNGLAEVLTGLKGLLRYNFANDGELYAGLAVALDYVIYALEKVQWPQTIQNNDANGRPDTASTPLIPFPEGRKSKKTKPRMKKQKASP